MFQENNTTTIDPMYEYNPEFCYWAKILEWALIRYMSSYVYKNYFVREKDRHEHNKGNTQ